MVETETVSGGVKLLLRGGHVTSDSALGPGGVKLLLRGGHVTSDSALGPGGVKLLLRGCHVTSDSALVPEKKKEKKKEKKYNMLATFFQIQEIERLIFSLFGQLRIFDHNRQ